MPKTVKRLMPRHEKILETMSRRVYYWKNKDGSWKLKPYQGNGVLYDTLWQSTGLGYSFPDALSLLIRRGYIMTITRKTGGFEVIGVNHYLTEKGLRHVRPS